MIAQIQIHGNLFICYILYLFKWLPRSHKKIFWQQKTDSPIDAANK